MAPEKERKTINEAFDSICDFEELYAAYRDARKQKRYRRDVMEYTENLEENLISTQNELLWETYKVGPYRPFYVTIPKLRLVMALQFRDRVVQHALYRCMNPFYDRLFIEDSYACRVGKGSHKAADRLQYWMRQVSRKPGAPWYYLKLDISKYFYRVNHRILLDLLKERVTDERLLRVLENIINSEDTAFGLPSGMGPEECTEDMWLTDVGMPIGNLTSQMFANIYLNEIDQHAKHKMRIHYYIRYMDDIIILHKDKAQLAEFKEEIADFLRDNLQLELNKKTAIRPVSLGVDFVGYRIYSTHRKLKKSTAYRIMHRMKTLSAQLAAEEISREEFDRVAASYKGVMSHCNSYGLRQRLNQTYKEAMGRLQTVNGAVKQPEPERRKQ
ncbi:MAG: RNA-dependent DNA polymerase [Clostridia bacterium]|nr:RNA-dependent DNA polymerase [Clostridia bacterium]